MNFWQNLSKPIFALAPMEDVTDTVFRRIVASCAAPDVFFTEFTNVRGLCSQGEQIVGQRLRFTFEERPIVAQIWGIEPEYFFQSAVKIVEMGFDGIDINFGCPQKKITSTGACAALINNQKLVAEIITAVKKGIASTGKLIPMSVKTRLGFKSIQTEWIEFILSQNLDALTIHGRTAAEMSDHPVHWDIVGEVVELRNTLKLQTLILGNGDIKSRGEGLEKINTYGLDGVMIGRGIFENMWVFDTHTHISSKEELLTLLKKHVALFESEWGEHKNFAIMKKFFKIYVRGFDNASELREKLMQTENKTDVMEILEKV